MKVPQSIGDIYDENSSGFERLGEAVGNRIRGHLNKEWHYVGRVKSRESFALKVETGRVQDPRQLEDFFGCTIVVRNMLEVAVAEKIIQSLFTQVERRPPKPNYMRSDPSAFDFDHLRIYMRWQDDDGLPPSEFTGLTFEIQIKTYLQHAWAIATHDLIYKTDDVNWQKARIAYQVKAMLDHAETSIAHAEQLAAAADLQVANERVDEIRAVIGVLKEVWTQDPARLPEDVRRLAENILFVMRRAGVSVDELKDDLIAEEAEGRGPLIETLSPFGIVVQTFLRRRGNVMKQVLAGGDRYRSRGRIVIPAEIELPTTIDPNECRGALFIPSR
jgi:ppGpp synthetase/RelA/SpoT-type nucleotidyltranferase